jgi:type II secretory pathway component PulJ
MISSKKIPGHARRGLTLIELLVTALITAVIGTVLATSVSQMMMVSAANNNRMDTIKQIENALHWINRDAQMAKTIELDPGTPSHFPLNINWKGWDVNPDTHQIDEYHVSYRVENGNLVRRYWLNNASEMSAPAQLVAGHIDTSSPEKSLCSVDSVGLSVVLTCTVDGFAGASETRTLNVKPGSS